MDLKNHQITIGEILKSPAAEEILRREFPELMTPGTLRMARNMSLEKVLKLAKGRYSQTQINRTIEELLSV